LQKRPTAVVVIYSASILHIVEAFILAESKAADTSIPIASLLDAFGGHRIRAIDQPDRNYLPGAVQLMGDNELVRS
jgi:hypothetical protein